MDVKCADYPQAGSPQSCDVLVPGQSSKNLCGGYWCVKSWSKSEGLGHSK